MSQSFQLIKKFYLGFGVLIALLVMVLSVAVLSYRQLTQANGWNIHTYQVLVEARGISESLTHMEGGALGFAITSEPGFLKELKKAQSEFPRHFEAAQRLTRDNPAQQTRLKKIGEQQRQWVKVYVAPMLATQSASLNPAATFQNVRAISLRGEPYATQMQSILADFSGEESLLLAQRNAQAERLGLWTAAVLSAGGVLAVALVALLSGQLAGSLRRLNATNAALAEQVAERTAAEAEAREIAERLKLVSEVSQVGDWDLDMATGKTHRSLRHDQIFGHDELLTEWNSETFLEHVHPEDRALAVGTLRRAIAAGGEWDFECRIVWADGSPHWIWGRGRVFQTENGKPTRMLGTVTDITERKLAQQETHALSMRLVQANHTNQRIMDTSLDVICTIDEARRFLQVSPASKKVWGYAPEELIGREFIDFVYAEDVETTLQASASIVSGQSTNSFENRYVHKNGAAVPMMWSAVWSESDQVTFCVARDNSERKEAEVAIRNSARDAERAREESERAKDEAERANTAKSDFLSRTSHELRTPLNAILGFGQLLEMEELEDGQRAGVEQILKGGRHLLQLVNEVLDIASIDAGRMALSCEAVQLSDLVAETLELLQPLANTRAIRLENRIGGGFVLADQQRLKQVLLNLISNAVKYNRDGGLVRLSSGTAATVGRVRFEVTDTGPGIPTANLNKLFSPFERLDAAEKGIEGTGIGLTISERLVRLMEGEMGVYSVENEGTTFWVELPGAQDPIQAVERRQTSRAPAENGEIASNGAAHTILYIEDNLSNLNLIEHILARRAETRLLSAMQGQIGLEMALQHRPNLILLDLHLPDMNGDEVLRRLQTQIETRDIPVVMLSADATPRQIERLLEAGATDYLTKPLDVKQFLLVMEETLNN